MFQNIQGVRRNGALRGFHLIGVGLTLVASLAGLGARGAGAKRGHGPACSDRALFGSGSAGLPGERRAPGAQADGLLLDRGSGHLAGRGGIPCQIPVHRGLGAVLSQQSQRCDNTFRRRDQVGPQLDRRDRNLCLGTERVAPDEGADDVCNAELQAADRQRHRPRRLLHRDPEQHARDGDQHQGHRAGDRRRSHGRSCSIPSGAGGSHSPAAKLRPACSPIFRTPSRRIIWRSSQHKSRGSCMSRRGHWRRC